MTSDAAINKHIKDLEGEVDLSKLKVGYTVKFLCGGQAGIKNVFDCSEHRINLIFKEEPNHKYNYMLDGSATGTCGPRVFDIIEIIPAAFDWDTVKPGMAFTPIIECNKEWTTVWFVSPSCDKERIIVTKDNRFEAITGAFSTFDKTDLIRVPEHDIEVPG